MSYYIPFWLRWIWEYCYRHPLGIGASEHNQYSGCLSSGVSNIWHHICSPSTAYIQLLISRAETGYAETTYTQPDISTGSLPPSPAPVAYPDDETVSRSIIISNQWNPDSPPTRTDQTRPAQTRATGSSWRKSSYQKQIGRSWLFPVVYCTVRSNCTGSTCCAFLPGPVGIGKNTKNETMSALRPSAGTLEH